MKSKLKNLSKIFSFVIFILISLPSQLLAQSNLLMFERDGCEWCEIWRQEVGIIYHKTPQGKQAPLIILNIVKKLPQEYSLDYPIYYSPTFVLIDNGKEIGRIEGYPGEEFFWAMFENLLTKL